MTFRRFIPVFLLFSLLTGGFSVAGVPDASKAQDMSLRWNRDFDLLIDMEDVPTLAQKKLEKRRNALLKERASLKRKLADLDDRIAAISGTFTNEVLLDEMLKLKVKDAASVRRKLQEQRAGTVRRIIEIDRSLKALSEKGES